MQNIENVNTQSSVSFKERKVVPELIDNFRIKGRKLENTLRELEWVNRHLGGINSFIYPVFKYIKQNHPEHLKVVDIGCGGGDILRKLYDLNSKTDSKIKLIGIDANPNILDYAKRTHFTGIPVRLIEADIMLEPEQIEPADVYMFNQILHHFELGKIQSLFNLIARYRPSLIVVNDLQRSKFAYWMFKYLCKFIGTSYLTSHDGQLSISKGFNEVEMRLMGDMIPGYTSELKWNWAFRWQLVFKKTDTTI